MEPIAILQADPLDILFEHRNKEYGAYPLRKFYNRRLLFSIGVMLGTVCLVSCLVFLLKPAVRGVVFVTPEITLIQPPAEKALPKIVKPAIRPSALPKKSAAIKAVTPLIVEDKKVPPIPEVKELDGKTIGAVSNSGPADNSPYGSTSTEGAGAQGQMRAADSATVSSDKKIYNGVERMPEFPGGPEALKRFLSRNLQAPETGQEAGTLVRVLARFVVSKDGTVTGLEINHSGGPDYDQEVLRVIGRMPKWKPGLQHNRPVNVYYVLPVVFTVSE